MWFSARNTTAFINKLRVNKKFLRKVAFISGRIKKVSAKRLETQIEMP